jgi:hypothetical protein
MKTLLDLPEKYLDVGVLLKLFYDKFNSFCTKGLFCDVLFVCDYYSIFLKGFLMLPEKIISLLYFSISL